MRKLLPYFLPCLFLLLPHLVAAQPMPGNQVVMPCPLSLQVTGCASVTDTTSTSLIAAGGATYKICPITVSCGNTGGSTVGLNFQNGSAGTTLWSTIAPTQGGSNISSSGLPVNCTSANTALYFQADGSSTTVTCCARACKFH